LISTGSGCARGTGCWTWAAAPDGTPSRCTGAAATSSRSTRTPTSSPFADGEFDRVVAAEVLEHIPADIQAIDELARVLRPGGTLAVSVPRWFPEIVNWKLSDDYHNTPGGHIRIYSDKELIGKLTNAGLEFRGKDYAHGLHSPYWWIKCAVGVKNDDHPLARAYHRLLVWEIMKQPTVLRLAGRVLDPLIGKSLVLYFTKPGAPG
jgi:SAM-dependent methyltransferase